MPYELTWHTPSKVLQLTIIGEYSPEIAKEANDAIVEELNRATTVLLLVIDATQMARPYRFQEIRATQHYMNHHRLRHIFVISNDKLIRLSIVIIFNLSRAFVQLFNTPAEAETLVQARLRNNGN